MKHNELTTEEKRAYEYWRKVVAFRDAAKYTEDALLWGEEY